MSFARGAAFEYLEKFFRGLFVSHRDTVTVGTTPVEILQADVERVSLIIVNLGADDVYITPDNRPSATRGIRLLASGGAFTCNIFQDGSLPTAEWWGYSPSDDVTVFYTLSRREVLTPESEG